jgi:nucleoside-diphosphate-sugar epimerase
MTRPHILIVGCGYVGRRLVARLASAHDITALVRTSESAAALERSGIRAVAVDLDRARIGTHIPERLEQAATVYLAPPPPAGESDLRLDRFLQLAAVPPRTFLYMSTTGVYGNADGGLVDESHPVNPLTERARRRVTAEEMTRVWCNERHVRRVVLRVAGIYGPGRLPIERLRRREAVVRPQDAGATARIHVDDLVEACVKALENEEARGVYNVSDGGFISSAHFFAAVARRVGLPDPPQVSMEEAQLTFSAERLSFLNESRRIDNQRMLTDLGVRLKYADMEAGIAASLQEEAAAARKKMPG